MPAVPAKTDRSKNPVQRDFFGGGERAFVRPFLKWAGGKTQLLPQLTKFFPREGTVERYFEPFLGSGAVFFNFKALVKPKVSVLWDNNVELVKTFVAVRDQVDDVIELLQEYQQQHSKDFYLSMRGKKPTSLPEVAARLIYLNKTCFNGLYRVNSRGEFNVPIGRYAKPSILNRDGLRRASLLLEGTQIEAKDFSELQRKVKAGDFIYFDPPYLPRSSTAYFTSYTAGSFGEKDQEKLAKLYRSLDSRDCFLMLSNSDMAFIHEQYSGFWIRKVSARRNINSNPDLRGPINELVIVNDKFMGAAHGGG
jgi:DNA adenine methylase